MDYISLIHIIFETFCDNNLVKFYIEPNSLALWHFHALYFMQSCKSTFYLFITSGIKRPKSPSPPLAQFYANPHSVNNPIPSNLQAFPPMMPNRMQDPENVNQAYQFMQVYNYAEHNMICIADCLLATQQQMLNLF